MANTCYGAAPGARLRLEAVSEFWFERACNARFAVVKCVNTKGGTVMRAYLLAFCLLTQTACGGSDNEGQGFCPRNLETLDGGRVCVPAGDSEACWLLEYDCRTGPGDTAIARVRRAPEGGGLFSYGCGFSDQAAECGEMVRIVRD